MKRKSKKRRTRKPKTRSGLPDLDQSKAAVIGSLRSPESQRGYRHAIDEFNDFAASKPIARGVLRDAAITRIRLAEAELTLRSAREFLAREVEDAWELVTAGGSLEPGRSLDSCRLFATHTNGRTPRGGCGA